TRTLLGVDPPQVSNLNRQFLFREHNVGQAKSRAASEAVRAMNKAIKVYTQHTEISHIEQ
ncbi:unnamed protein product, partial [Sphacelaria rigidula]